MSEKRLARLLVAFFTLVVFFFAFAEDPVRGFWGAAVDLAFAYFAAAFFVLDFVFPWIIEPLTGSYDKRVRSGAARRTTAPRGRL